MIMVSNLIKSICCICGAFLIHFSLGTLYTFGNMSPYVASYLRLRTDNTWVTPGHMVWIFSMAVFSQGFTMSLGGLMQNKIGARLTCLIGAWTMSISTILTFLSIKKNIWAVITTYGFFFGCGTGLTYAVALSAPIKWFPERKGFVTGMVVAGYGLGSLLFNLVQTRYINPLNISPNATEFSNNSTNVTTSRNKYFYDKNVLDKIPTCFLIIGGTYAAIQLIGVLLLMDQGAAKPSDEVTNHVATSENGTDVKETLVDGINEDEDKHSSNHTGGHQIKHKAEDSGINYSVKEAIRMRKFWILWWTFFFNGVVIVMISSLYKAFGQQFINNDRFFSIVGAVAAIFNSGGRLIWGRLLDMLTYRIMMSSLTVTMAVVMGTFYLCSLISTASGAMSMYAIWVCLLFFCLAGNFAMFPTATAQAFGNKNMAIIYGLVFAGYAISSILGALVCSMLLSLISYGGQFAIATIMALISLILTQFFEPIKGRQLVQKEEMM